MAFEQVIDVCAGFAHIALSRLNYRNTAVHIKAIIHEFI